MIEVYVLAPSRSREVEAYHAIKDYLESNGITAMITTDSDSLEFPAASYTAVPDLDTLPNT